MPPKGRRPVGGIKRRLAEASAEASASSQPTPIVAHVAASSLSSSSATPFVRGGIRQRLQTMSPAVSGPGLKNMPLLRSLKRDWAKGLIHSPQVQEYAQGAMAQGARGCERVAAAGASGAHPQNMQRALISFFGMPQGAPAFTWFSVPTKHGPVKHPFLLPHLWFQSLYRSAPEHWATSIVRFAEDARNFWESMKDTAFVKNHPHLPRSNWSRIVPFGMHGDGGAFSKQDSLYIFTWNSLLGTGSTRCKRFMFTIMKKSLMTEGTLDAIFKLFSWSMNVLLTGLTPERDIDQNALAGGGEYLADGWRGALVQIRGDWEFYCSIFNFPTWQGAENMCWLCRASSLDGPLKFVRCGDDAGWRPTRRTHESYLAELLAKGIPIPILFALCVGLRLECIMIDILHTVDLGVAAHVIGNVFWELVCAHAWGFPTQEKNVEALMEEMQRWYKSTKATSRVQGKLTVERIRTTKGWPKLKAKAAATRHLAKFALVLASRYGGSSAHDRRRVAICQMLVRFYELVDGEGMFLSEAAKAEIPDLGKHFGVLYSHLATEAAVNGVRFWKMSPKLHLFIHLCEWQSVDVGNPRFYWTYADEDLVGHMVEVGSSCHPRTLAVTALFKWITFAFPTE